MPTRRTSLAVVLVLPWAAWAIVRVLGLERGHPWVALLAFTPYAAATAVLPVLAALALRRPRVAAAALLPLGVLAVAVLPRAVGGGAVPAGADGPELRVMTANLRLGTADMVAVLRLAERERVDVIAFEELTPEALARFDAAGGRRRFPGRAVEPRPGAAGSGLLARRPLTARARDDATAAEQPGAVLRTPGGAPLQVKLVHPYPPISATKDAAWSATLADLPRPHGRGPLRLVLGDFNATLDHAALRDVVDGGYRDAADATGEGLVWTYGEGRTRRLTIDHVLLDRRLGVRAAAVHRIPRSDHRAVVATLVLPAQ